MFFLFLRKTFSSCFTAIPWGWEQTSKARLWGLGRGIPGAGGSSGRAEGRRKCCSAGPGRADTAGPKGSSGKDEV